MSFMDRSAARAAYFNTLKASDGLKEEDEVDDSHDPPPLPSILYSSASTYDEVPEYGRHLPVPHRASSPAWSFETTSSSYHPSTVEGTYQLPPASFEAGDRTRCHPGGGTDGFWIELPGGGGSWKLGWEELIGVLADPVTTSMLPDFHIAKRLAAFLTSQLEDNDNHHYSSAHRQLWSEPSSTTLSHSLPDPPALAPDHSYLYLSRLSIAAGSPPPEERPRTDSIFALPSQQAQESLPWIPITFAENAQREFDAFHNQATSHQSSPYARATANEPIVSVPTHVAPGMNEGTERYVWSTGMGQLGRASTEYEMVGSELLVFPPGSYTKVFKEGVELLPCDLKSMNEWIRGQHCVPDCRFNFSRKRPATIRAHVTNCKHRADLTSDPMKRLCELQNVTYSRRVRSDQSIGSTSAQSTSSKGHQTVLSDSPRPGSHPTSDDDVLDSIPANPGRVSATSSQSHTYSSPVRGNVQDDKFRGPNAGPSSRTDPDRSYTWSTPCFPSNYGIDVSVSSRDRKGRFALSGSFIEVVDGEELEI